MSQYIKETGKNISLSELNCSNGYIRPKKEKIFEVKMNDHVREGMIKHQDGGFWFELMVAGCFLSAGADEVQCNVKWDWPKEPVLIRTSDNKTYRSFMTEVDVICRFKHRFVAVSCKLEQKLAQPKREIEAVARAGLGRFCIPIFIRPKISDDIIEESINSNIGAVLLDIEYIAYPDRLKDILIKAFKSRTTSER